VQARAESSPETSDEALLAACLRGDQLAWNALIDRYAALIYSIPLKYRLGEADAADVFQSVCLTLLEKLGSIRAPRGLAAWIITTTSRQCWAVIRQQTRQQARAADERELEAASEPPDPLPLPEETVLALERQYLVRRAVGQLPPRCRELVEKLFLLGDASRASSYQELAARLGMPLNSLGPTRSRCLSHLRRLLAEAGYVHGP
jgi:RNA polymerase sigma factor (sigma-70 family)